VTYDEAARRFSVKVCSDCPNGDHGRGYAQPRLNTIHWRTRRVNKFGLRRFLLLVAQLRLINFDTLSGWERIRASNTWVAQTGAKTLRVRFRRELADADRAEARWLMNRAGAEPSPEMRRWLRKEP
jgi:hypothetical protein